MLAQPLSVLLTAFAAVAASSVGGETEPGVRLTLMRPSNSTAMARLVPIYLFICFSLSPFCKENAGTRAALFLARTVSLASPFWFGLRTHTCSPSLSHTQTHTQTQLILFPPPSCTHRPHFTYNSLRRKDS